MSFLTIMKTDCRTWGTKSLRTKLPKLSIVCNIYKFLRKFYTSLPFSKSYLYRKVGYKLMS